MDKKYLTKEQRKLAEEAYGDGKDWPKFTNDPRVNHFVDLMIGVETRQWNLLTDEERQAYVDEIEEWKKHEK